MTTMTTKYFHGTSGLSWKRIAFQGIRPRLNRPGNFARNGTNTDSNPLLSYFTSCVSAACFYAYRSSLASADDTSVIVGIRFRDSDESRLRVDENWVDAVTRGCSFNCPQELRIKQREQATFDGRWQQSIDLTRLASYIGEISTDRLSVEHAFPLVCNPFYLRELEAISDVDEKIEVHNAWLSCYLLDNEHYWRMWFSGRYLFSKLTPFVETRKRVEECKRLLST